MSPSFAGILNDALRPVLAFPMSESNSLIVLHRSRRQDGAWAKFTQEYHDGLYRPAVRWFPQRTILLRLAYLWHEEKTCGYGINALLLNQHSGYRRTGVSRYIDRLLRALPEAMGYDELRVYVVRGTMCLRK